MELIKHRFFQRVNIFFEICDEATGLAEAYSQRKASSLSVLEKLHNSRYCCVDASDRI